MGGVKGVRKDDKRKLPWVADYEVVLIENGQKVVKRKRRFFLTKSEAQDCYEETRQRYLADLQKPITIDMTLQDAAQYSKGCS